MTAMVWRLRRLGKSLQFLFSIKKSLNGFICSDQKSDFLKSVLTKNTLRMSSADFRGYLAPVPHPKSPHEWWAEPNIRQLSQTLNHRGLMPSVEKLIRGLEWQAQTDKQFPPKIDEILMCFYCVFYLFSFSFSVNDSRLIKIIQKYVWLIKKKSEISNCEIHFYRIIWVSKEGWI